MRSSASEKKDSLHITPPLKTKTWPFTDESPVSRSPLARGDKQTNAVLYPHKEH